MGWACYSMGLCAMSADKSLLACGTCWWRVSASITDNAGWKANSQSPGPAQATKKDHHQRCTAAAGHSHLSTQQPKPNQATSEAPLANNGHPYVLHSIAPLNKKPFWETLCRRVTAQKMSWSLKVLICGDGAIGKVSLLRRAAGLILCGVIDLLARYALREG